MSHLSLAPNMAKVLAVCGMPAAGKGLFAEILAEKGVPVRSMGDMVRAEVRRIEIEETPGIFGEVASQLRAEHGDDILAHRLIEEVDSLLEHHSIVLIEGMRGIAERSVFKNHWGKQFNSVAITANEEIRFKRVQQRNRSEDGTRNDFDIRDKREIGWGLDILIAEADFSFTNESGIDVLRNIVEDWFNSH